MAAELELRWLKIDGMEGSLKRFAEFCKMDIREQSKQADFDVDLYQDAVKMILKKLDNKEAIKEIFNAD